jgi:hypothetical protein
MAEEAKNIKSVEDSGLDKETALYRDLVQVPTTFEDGFNFRTFIGVLFVCIVMMPTSIYLGLTMGLALGPAAEWVTIILFADVARRSFKPLKRQEIYMLYYVAASLMTFAGGRALAGGPMAQVIWKQYLCNTPFAQEMGVFPFPTWYIPAPGSGGLTGRTFLHSDWIIPVVIMFGMGVYGRVAWVCMGYSLFRVTSDMERLPFPMASIASEGATALAESSQEGESWRWRVFSIGSVLGMAFGAVYSLVPMLTKAFFGEPVMLLPIPWIDTTVQTEGLLPAAETGIATNLGMVIVGMVLPFWLVFGSFLASMTHMFVNPLLHELGILTHWRPGMDTIMTDFMNRVDFWMSFGIGTSLSIAVLGFWHVINGVRKARRERAAGINRRSWKDVPEGRGDFSIRLALTIFGIGTLVTTLVAWYMLTHPSYPVDEAGKVLAGATPWAEQSGYTKIALPLILFGFAFIYTPLMSYVNARMWGLTGKTVQFPMLREATFILSGYQGAAIWCAPFPLRDYGRNAQSFRVFELTGTKFTSIIKAELCLYPITFVASFVFWQYVWHYGDPIPSPTYPFAQKMWQLHALKQCLVWSATAKTGGQSLFFLAFKLKYVIFGLALGLSLFALLASIKAPTLMLYGFVGGMSQIPHVLLPEFVGALLGRYYFARLIGREKWRRYTPVLAAGFFCGVGLISMIGVAFMLLRGCITPRPYLILPGG